MNIYHGKFASRFFKSIFKRFESTLPKVALENIKTGQPTSISHPHLLKPGELCPSITVEEFQDRRRNLLELIFHHNLKLRDNANPHLLIVPSATKKYMSDKIPYVFRQNTDYLYLSGCLEPNTCLVIATKGKSRDFETTLFVQNPNVHAEIWDGPRLNKESAPSLFGVENSCNMLDLPNFLTNYVANNKDSIIWYELGDFIQPGVEKMVTKLIHCNPTTKHECLKRFIQNLRLIKSPAEIALMQKSCEIASAAINETIGMSHPGISEHQIFARMDYESRMKGAEFLAYPPVVAGGDRATIIHHINNNQIVNNGEMVLMDAGCEYHGYSSDITRTWPINGKFTPEQRILYEIVRSIQNDLIKTELLQFDKITLDYLFNSMCSLLGRRLQEIGLIPKNANKEQLYKAAYSFCPHHVSHYLGMDVHDTHLIPRNVRLEPGMIITVEPGIYIPKDRKDVPKDFRGIGIRIEDNILITENGPIVLTNNCMKTIEEIENVINAKKRTW